MSTTTEALPITCLEDFLGYLATGEDPHARISPEIVAEMNFPNLSFTLTGKPAFDHARAQVGDGPWTIRLTSAEALDDGFLAVLDYDAGFGGHLDTYRTINAVTLLDGRVVRLRHWCTGALPRA